MKVNIIIIRFIISSFFNAVEPAYSRNSGY